MEHEHIIYISNFLIKKLQEAIHYYIDGTFIFPKPFKQLIVIQYLDIKNNKRFPGCFMLINIKTQSDYTLLFSNLYKILTNEYTKKFQCTY